VPKSIVYNNMQMYTQIIDNTNKNGFEGGHVQKEGLNDLYHVIALF